METYYNTNNETGSTLDRSERTAARQEEVVLKYFEDNPGEKFAAHEIHQEVLQHVLLTSVRRAITNLCNGGLIDKTDYMVMGPYGKNVATWKLRSPSMIYKIFGV